MIARLAALALVWLAAVAATPLPLRPPPPDLTTLVPFVAAPMGKPALAMPRLPLPATPIDLPDLPLVAPVQPRTAKPIAPVPVPRPLACGLAWLPVASEALECGLARFARGEYEDAVRALEQAIRGNPEAWVLTEGRYWLAETFVRMGRHKEADPLFQQVARETSHQYAPWALHSSGWTALSLGQFDRARLAFETLLRSPRGVPVPLDAWGLYGLGLSLYALRRYEDSQKVWSDFLGRRHPQTLERDAVFWHGEVLGRLNRPREAAQALNRFTQPADLHPLQWTALVRLGWRNLQAGWAPESAQTFRAFLGSTPSRDAVLAPNERQWAEAGLALALLQLGDVNGASSLLRDLDARKAPMAAPVRMMLAARAVEAGQTSTAASIAQQLLGGDLSPALRSWVLMLKGDALLAEGNRDEARTQYDLVRQVGGSANAPYAAVRLARVNFELREFQQALQDLVPVLSGPSGSAGVPAELRQAALLLAGEAAFSAGDHATAARAYRALLAEAPGHPQAAGIQLALAWTALHEGQRDEALRLFQEFARTHSADPHAPDALVLASELVLASGNLDLARQLLDRILVAHGSHPRAEFARLNRALLMLRTGQPGPAQRELRDWIARAPFPPLLGRAHGALGAALLAAGNRAEAAREFERARQEGFTEIAALGRGAVALMEDRLDEAAKLFTEARDSGLPGHAAAASYGLAVVAFHRGAPRDFERLAVAAIDEAPRGPVVPDYLYVLVGLAAQDGDWSGAMAMARRLVNDFPDHEAVDDALERVGAAAARASAWPVAAQAYLLMRQRYPHSPFIESSRVTYAQALINTGRADEGRRALEEFVKVYPNDPQAPRAWMVLARVREAAGDRAGATEAFGRAAQGGQDREARQNHARLLVAAKRWEEARRALAPEMKDQDTGVVADTALAIAETYEGQGDHLAAAEYYMTAAYLAPQSVTGRRALLAAGRAFAALKQPEAAATVYRKLLAQADVPADMAGAARKALAELRR